MTIAEAAELPAVSNLHGEEKQAAHLWIIGEIVAVFKQFNFPENKLPERHVVQDWGMDLLEGYPSLSLEEFAVFFRLVRKGMIDLGMFERIGYDILKNAMDKYLALRRRKIQPTDTVKAAKGFNVSDYAKIVLDTIAQGAPKEEPLKRSSRPPAITESVTYDLLKEDLPNLSDEDLTSLLNQYKNVNIYDHLIMERNENGEEKPRKNRFVKLIEDEIERRK